MVDPRLCGCCGACGVGPVSWQSAIGFLLLVTPCQVRQALGGY